jgi:hypothetical protein
LLRRFLVLITVLAASSTGVLLSDRAAFATGPTEPAVETQGPLATGVLLVSVISVIVLIAFVVIRNRRTLLRRSRRVIRRIARRFSHHQ